MAVVQQQYSEAGIPPAKFENYCESTRSVYRCSDKEWDYAGYATSFLYSSLLKRPLAIAKLPLDLARIGTKVNLEIQIIHRPATVTATVERMPFFNPSRKTSEIRELEHVS